MTVCVTLDHCDEFRWPDQLPEFAHIERDRIKIDDGPGGPQK
jgi:hypothetical protein